MLKNLTLSTGKVVNNVLFQRTRGSRFTHALIVSDSKFIMGAAYRKDVDHEWRAVGNIAALGNAFDNSRDMFTKEERDEILFEVTKNSPKIVAALQRFPHLLP